MEMQLIYNVVLVSGMCINIYTHIYIKVIRIYITLSLSKGKMGRNNLAI